VLRSVTLGRRDAWGRRGGRRQGSRVSALRAELGCWRELTATVSTCPRQRRGALLAELRARPVLVLAPRAFHRGRCPPSGLAPPSLTQLGCSQARRKTIVSAHHGALSGRGEHREPRPLKRKVMGRHPSLRLWTGPAQGRAWAHGARLAAPAKSSRAAAPARIHDASQLSCRGLVDLSQFSQCLLRTLEVPGHTHLTKQFGSLGEMCPRLLRLHRWC
jgi:hypothetical protein